MLEGVLCAGGALLGHPGAAVTSVPSGDLGDSPGQCLGLVGSCGSLSSLLESWDELRERKT